MVDKTLQLEHNPVYTQNTDYLANEKRRWYSFYTGARQRHWQYHITPYEHIESEETAEEIVRIPEDKFQQALSVMANVRAYFQVTYKVNISKMTLQSRCQGLTSSLFSESSTTFLWSSSMNSIKLP
jgi:hypothetical protein